MKIKLNKIRNNRKKEISICKLFCKITTLCYKIVAIFGWAIPIMIYVITFIMMLTQKSPSTLEICTAAISATIGVIWAVLSLSKLYNITK